MLRDGAALVEWAAALRWDTPVATPPPSEALAFLNLALTRYAAALAAAPGAGDPGARLLVATAGVLLTWIGTLAFGRGIRRSSQPAGWSLPLLAATALTATLGGGTTGLVIGVFALLLAGALAATRAREMSWEQSGTDYSDEIRRDVAGWGGLLVAGALLVAWAVPLWPGNPLAQLLAQVETPSGIDALQRGIERPRTPAPARVGLSSLPLLPLGESLEQGPPGQLALRVRTDRPLPEGPAPRYWRVRLLNQYGGIAWASDATVGAQPPLVIGANIPADLVAQEVEDLRRDRRILPGLADMIGADLPASAERLGDGSLAALVSEATPGRYRVISRLMEHAPLPPPDRAAPDMTPYLALPRALPARVRDLASIVSGSGELLPPIERAIRLEAYLRELPYSYEVRPLPRDGDAVDQFLFEMRAGYCTYYASAMAVMARSLGIPARIAVGYVTGEYDPVAGVHTVRERDAHAWPELYIAGRWVAFEPTPVRPLPARAARSIEADTAAAAPAPLPADRTTGPLVWVAVLVLVALATLIGLRIGRPRRPVAPDAQAQQELEGYGKRLGVSWPPGTTIHEYGELLASRANGEGPALRDLVELVARARYGGRALDPAERRRLADAGERLRAGGRRR
jgi:transglutaminase-like putative cysteine protease